MSRLYQLLQVLEKDAQDILKVRRLNHNDYSCCLFIQIKVYIIIANTIILNIVLADTGMYIQIDVVKMKGIINDLVDAVTKIPMIDLKANIR